MKVTSRVGIINGNAKKLSTLELLYSKNRCISII